MPQGLDPMAGMVVDGTPRMIAEITLQRQNIWSRGPRMRRCHAHWSASWGFGTGPG
ncbi:MAG TPA: hypothetical protein DEF41_00595 [Desulfovibrio sp.]|nr:hypothetical protein [Desulfovibrio sp.]